MTYLHQFTNTEPLAILSLIAMALGVVAGLYLDRFEK